MGLLESCPTCKNPTSENSTACPKCGEPLEKGWAEKLRTLREEKENSERVKTEKKEKATKKKSMRKFLIGAFLFWALIWGHNTYLLIFDPEGYDRKIAAEEVQRLTEIEQLTKEAASIPASDYDKNIDIYERLSSLDRDNKKFSDKVTFYKDKKEASERAIDRAKETERHRTGLHCLSAFSGAHSGVKDSVKRSLRDSDSFEHIKTLIFPLRKDMTHRLRMRYRAKNGFGGYVVETVEAIISNDDCSVISITKQ